MNKSSCRVRTLANDGLCKVDYCLDCKVFHLQVGYATLHLHPEGFVALRSTIDTALTLFQRQKNAANAEPLASAPEVKNAFH
ncbi:MAG TPA: hypothetical protein VLU73_17050 [Methylococcaceae bacterium]|jgi:hypothetical protein|nr:hypothetical protein [Methylococcaceae bacterium]